MNKWISERKVLNTVKSAGWEQIDPRGRTKPQSFVRKVNGETCEAYGHFKKGNKLVAVACSDRRHLGQMIYIRTINAIDDFRGNANRHIIADDWGSQAQWEKGIVDDLVYQLELIEEGK